MSDTVIRVEGLWKRYGLRLPEALRLFAGGRRGRRIPPHGAAEPGPGPWALKDVSFELTRGGTLGLVGRNGAGKSTILKILAGVTPPTWGRVEVRGRIFPMIELNAGVQPDLTGRENVFLLAHIMGMPRREIRSKLRKIEEYSELEEWLDRPVRMYSSGMLARLGFSVAVNAEAEVLLIDELLSVGDAAFQKKCLRSIENLIIDGVTVVFVSHNPYSVERLCTNAILLDRGEVSSDGSSSAVIADYFRALSGGGRSPETASPVPERVDASPARSGTGELRIERVSLFDPIGKKAVETVQTDEGLKIEMDLQITDPDLRFLLGVRIFDAFNTLVANIVLPRTVIGASSQLEVKRLTCLLPRIPLMPGSYVVDVMCKEAGRVVDHFPNAALFDVVVSDEVALETAAMGLVHIPAEWSAEPKTW